MKETPWENPEGADLHKDRVTTLSSGLNSMFKGLSPNRRDVVAAQVTSLWEASAPQSVLDHTGSVFIETNGGRRALVVLVDSSMLAAELSARSIYFLVRINETLQQRGYDIRGFDSITFRVSRRVSRDKKAQKWRQQSASYKQEAPLVELDADELGRVADQTASITDQNLKKSVENAMKANLRWKKSIEASKRR